jgi:hypothetical protein
MRFFASLFVSAGVALAVAGCDPATERQYVREGVGTDLYTDNITGRTQLQDIYVAHICEQAGLAAGSCAVDNFSPTVWTLFVQAGMNDIDQRCDAYLAWLDAQRRDREPVLRQLATMAAATTAIMSVSGAGTDSLTVVAEAFGLAAATYANWNSRLLLDVNHSTVQTIVYSRQTEFRNAVAKESVPNRPRGLYLLRNYLRLCMPITIATDINTSVTLVQRDAGAAVKGRPVVGVAAKPLAALQKITQPVRPELPPTPGYSEFIKNYNPAVFTPALVKPALQRLCVKDVDAVGASTVPLVQIYQLEKGAQPTGKLTLSQLQSLKGDTECPADRLNYYEAHGMTAGLITPGTLSLLDAGLPENQKIQGTPTIEDVRNRILPQIRNSAVGAKLTLKSPDLSGQFTRDLMTELTRLKFQPNR